MRRRRLLKFDVVHPASYLDRKHAEWDDLGALSAAAYRDRLNRLRSNYSDYYTHYLDEQHWQGEEFYLHPTYLDKVAREMYGAALPLRRLPSAVRQRLHGGPAWMKRVVGDYIRTTQPDVLFVRSQPLPSAFWQRFRDDCLLVARLSARMPRQWHPEHFDVIYTDVPVFRDFFALHDVPVYLNDQGFDPRLLDELDDRPKQRDVTFVGGLGTTNFSKRTRLLERIAAEVPSFQWWGYWYPSWTDSTPTDAFPNLQRTFQGPTSGREMFQIYRDSRICLNDYVDTADGLGVNQRMYEVMGVGSFLLTREAPNLDDDFPGRPFGTYDGEDACLDRIRYFLEHDEEREALARRGQALVLEDYNYRDIVRDVGDTLLTHLEQPPSSA
jgi:hypothetical protein